MPNLSSAHLFGLVLATSLTLPASPASAEPPADVAAQVSSYDLPDLSLGQIPFATTPGPLYSLQSPVLPPLSIDDEGPAMKRRSVGMVVGGSILTGAGLFSSLGGFALYAQNVFIVCALDCAPGVSCSCGSDAGAALGLGLMVLGLGSIGGGIAMIVIGAQKVPAEPSAALVVKPGGLSFEGTF